MEKLSKERVREISDMIVNQKFLEKTISIPTRESLEKEAEKIGITPEELKLYILEKMETRHTYFKHEVEKL